MEAISYGHIESLPTKALAGKILISALSLDSKLMGLMVALHLSLQ